MKRYLRTESLDSQDSWRNIKGEIVLDKTAYLIFDDTVINKKSIKCTGIILIAYFLSWRHWRDDNIVAGNIKLFVG